MSSNRRDPPPPEAYSRVTNPERFRPLHDRAEELLRRLHTEFDVIQEEGWNLGEVPGRGTLARASVRLTPRRLGAAPILISFTTFPGVYLSFGRAAVEVFPHCGCDACGSDGDEEARRMTESVEDIVAGRFEERLLPHGTAWRVWSDHHERCSGDISAGNEGAELLRWEPWRRRSV